MKEDLPRIRRKPGFLDIWLDYPEYTVSERIRVAAHLTDRHDNANPSVPGDHYG